MRSLLNREISQISFLFFFSFFFFFFFSFWSRRPRSWKLAGDNMVPDSPSLIISISSYFLFPGFLHRRIAKDFFRFFPNSQQQQVRSFLHLFSKETPKIYQTQPSYPLSFFFLRKRFNLTSTSQGKYQRLTSVTGRHIAVIK